MKVKLRDVSNIIMGQSPDSSTYNTEKIGLPFFQGNADFGELNPIAKTWCSAPIKIAYKNYILISVRAPIGALNIAAETCCIGRGLAAFDVNNKMCTQKYLWYLLKAKKNELLSKGTGSTFKAISKNILSEMEFNIPPVREQELCTKVLEVVFCLIRLKKEQLDKLDLLVKSRFIEMFGDPVINSKGWITKRLPELGTLSRGMSKHRPRNAPELLGGPYPLIQTGDVANADGYIKEYTSTYSELGFRQSKMWPKGTLCITIAANIAKTAILEFASCFPDSIVGFNAYSAVTNEYIHHWFTFVQRIIEEQAPESAQKNINMKILSDLKVMVPDKNIQHEYVDFLKQVDKSKFVVTAKFQ